MGGDGSGGANKTHRTVEDYKRIDSFGFYSYLQGDDYLYCKDMVYYPNNHEKTIIFYVSEWKADIKTGNNYVPLLLCRTLGINSKSILLYFKCPHCHRRVRYLYDNKGKYICRHCLGANYKIQQSNGMDKLRQQMKYIVEDRLKYHHWRADQPDAALETLVYIPRPRYMRIDKYERLMIKLRGLQREYKRLYNKIMFSLPRRWS